MKVKVIYPFRDKDNFAKEYKVGDIVDFDAARVAILTQKGLVEKQEQKLFTSSTDEGKEEQSEEPTTTRKSKRYKD